MSDDLTRLWRALDLSVEGAPFVPAGSTLAREVATIACEDPSRAAVLAHVRLATRAEAESVASAAQRAFPRLRDTPGPVRGELVRRLAEALRQYRGALAELVTLEVGKCPSEAEGEVQEMIDIADYAVGLSRALGGRTLLSERPGHRLFEQWHPLGPVLCITAFNFPLAVWAWNAALSLVCGDPVVWKPSLKAPLCALACHGVLSRVLAREGHPDALGLVIGTDDEVSAPLVRSPIFPLVSATGSCAMGRAVGPVVAARFGRSLLELGGNNAVLVERTADLDLTSRAIAFGAAGTAGQRCTTTRRVYAEASIVGPLLERLVPRYADLSARTGDPRDRRNLVGPLIDRDAVERFLAAVARARDEGGVVLAGGQARPGPGYFVEPTLVYVEQGATCSVMQEETFAPILYVQPFTDGDLDRAIGLNNAVEQGLSSAIFTDSVRAAERFFSPAGSDCGIANCNLGTSGAEIGGAFGGEKATGGGREAGSDAWKAYMRRQTCTVNGTGELPLAQGVVWTT